MTRTPKTDPIACEFYMWHLRLRDGVYYADGRANKGHPLGKHSLGTRNRTEALKRLRALDRKKAVQAGLVEETENSAIGPTSISEGWKEYLEYCGRSPVMGGLTPGSQARYRNGRDRHVKFCEKRRIKTWDKFNRRKLEQYGNSISKRLAYRTCYVDLTLIKGVVNWLIAEGFLPPEFKLVYPLRKPEGTDTYCYSRAELSAMQTYCEQTPGLEWLGHIIVGLSHTGVRIGELIGMRWSDIDLEIDVVRIADERSSNKRTKAGIARTTKGRRSRTIPIHKQLRETLLEMEHKTDGYVFRAARGGVLRENNALKIFKEQVLEPLSKEFPTPEGEIGFQHGTFHSFRHFFCSQCFLGGASSGEIREWLGHSESKIVEHYRHLRSEEAQRKMNQINFLGSDDEGA